MDAKCGICKWNCIQAPYGRLLYRYGRFVGRHPWWFVAIPVIICLALSTGIFTHMTRYSSAVGLYCPQDSQTHESENRIDQLFPKGILSPLTARNSRKLTSVVVKSLNGNVLEEKNIRHIFTIYDSISSNLSTSSGIQFQHVCAKWEGECLIDQPFFMVNYNNSAKDAFLSRFLADLSAYVTEERFFSGITYGAGGNTVEGAKVLQWMYVLREDLTEDVKDWMTHLYNVVEREDYDTPDLKFAIFSVDAVDAEIIKTEEELIRYIVPAIFLIVVFCVATCLMLDPVKSKPLLAVAGTLSPCLALGGAFGLLFYVGQPFVATVGCVPFLVIGIGVDGMFVLLSVWRQTFPYLPNDERMALTFQKGGVSVTITGLTDIIGMAVGVVNPFRSVEQFCRFATLATAADLLLQLTFFGGCLALAGKREEANRHSLIPCLVLPAPSQAAGSKSGCTKLFCVGGVDKSKQNPSDNKEHAGSRLFGTFVARWLRQPVFAALATLLYFCYVGGAAYGYLNIQEELTRNYLGVKGSKFYDMLELHTESMLSYRFPSLVFDEPLVYSSDADQRKISNLVYEITHTKETHVYAGISWIDAYSNFLKDKRIQPVNELDYISILQDFLKIPLYRPFESDIVFSSDFSTILASRIHLSQSKIITTVDEKRVYAKLRKILSEHKLNTFVYNPLFHYAEQYILIVPNTVQLLGVATLGMLFVAFLFLPNPLISFVITFSVVSIEAGVIGYISLWDVQIDVMTMLGLLVTLGFVVDFSAHLAYAFASQPGEDKLKHAFSLMGFPLLQSSVSTVIGSVILLFCKAPIAITWFKIILFLMIFGTLHGLLWIPLVLNFLTFCCKKPQRQNRLSTRASVSGLTRQPRAPNHAIAATLAKPLRTSRRKPEETKKEKAHAQKRFPRHEIPHGFNHEQFKTIS